MGNVFWPVIVGMNFGLWHESVPAACLAYAVAAMAYDWIDYLKEVFMDEGEEA